MGVVGAERFAQMRAALAVGLQEWADEFGFALPGPGDELAVQIIGLLVGAAFQYRLEPAAVPKRTVVSGLRRVLGLSAEPAPVGAVAPGEPPQGADT